MSLLLTEVCDESFFLRKGILVGCTVVVLLSVIVGIPVIKTAGGPSSETREYWANSKDILWHIDTKDKMIALTFDDGPSPTFTPQILDILQKNDAKGTFFLIAKEAVKYPQIVQRMVYDGNEVANHTYHHIYLRGYSKDQVKKEVLLAENAIFRASRVNTKLFRPPGGYYNENIVSALRELGYLLVIWSWEQQPKDWANPGTGTIIKRVTTNVNSGNIIVFHDRGGNRVQTVQALQPIIRELKRRGFRLVTISEMIRNAEANATTKR